MEMIQLKNKWLIMLCSVCIVALFTGCNISFESKNIDQENQIKDDNNEVNNGDEDDSEVELQSDSDNDQGVQQQEVSDNENSSDGEFGEDPDTMVSEEEMAAMEEIQGEDEFTDLAEDRMRILPEDYEELLTTVKTKNDLYDEDGVLSIEEEVMRGGLVALEIIEGFPQIFPQEWYLLDELDQPMESSWSGTFCTDTPMNQAIVDHHERLANYNADIEFFLIEEMLKPNVISEVAFAFNDEYGTGSWDGSTQFFISPEDDGTYPMYKCMTVSMEFSPEIIE